MRLLITLLTLLACCAEVPPAPQPIPAEPRQLIAPSDGGTNAFETDGGPTFRRRGHIR